MQRVGEQVLDKVCTERMISKEYRFGFHLPPVNSVDHIHLHCFVLPITSWKYNWLVYGWGLNSVESVIKKIDKIQNT